VAVSALEILRRRVDALLHHSGKTRKELAIYMGKQPSWSTSFLLGHHGVTLKDLDRLARFFGLSVPALFELDGYRFRDRRHGQRRSGIKDRRSGTERRNVATSRKEDRTDNPLR
jgi:transcriptional regulator with XRE-family HTH domain